MAKARSLYLLLAREVTTDTNDQMNSIIKIIETFSSTIDTKTARLRGESLKGPLGLTYNYGIASSWLFDEKIAKGTKIRITFETIDPENKSIGLLENEYVMPKALDKLNINHVLNVMPATTSGTYTLKASLFSERGTLLANAAYPYEVELKWLEDDGAKG
jgi:hypothetical protein